MSFSNLSDPLTFPLVFKNWLIGYIQQELQISQLTGYKRVFGGAASFSTGVGTPESHITAPIGSLYTRSDGGASTTLYVKESGTGNTGWVAK